MMRYYDTHHKDKETGNTIYRELICIKLCKIGFLYKDTLRRITHEPLTSSQVWIGNLKEI